MSRHLDTSLMQCAIFYQFVMTPIPPTHVARNNYHALTCLAVNVMFLLDLLCLDNSGQVGMDEPNWPVLGPTGHVSQGALVVNFEASWIKAILIELILKL
ncbi:hypothetical protein RRG08_050024 [Elysia crispata]|uniref:Uncharacterized protein n=1 Tax=Elysia crispata TaxID=231223 RepID=A0AAE1EDM5_9GAST|nr:hypothetical protein RRG08_050024 [Elysia crispata]